MLRSRPLLTATKAALPPRPGRERVHFIGVEIPTSGMPICA